jgi:integrase
MEPINANQILNDFLKSMGILESYPPLVDLVERLQVIAPVVLESDIPGLNEEFWDSHLGIIANELKKRGRVRRGGTRYQGNSAGGNFHLSELCGAIQASAEDERVNRQYLGLIALMAARSLSGLPGEIEQRYRNAQQIRRLVLGNAPVTKQVLGELPEFTLETAGRYYFHLYRKIGNLKNKILNLPPDDRKFLRLVEWLLNGYPPIRKAPANLKDLSGQQSESRYTSIPWGAESRLPGDITDTDEYSDDENRGQEAPERHRSYEETADDDEYIDDRNVALKARQARYWLARTESFSIINRSNLNEIERKVLTDYLSKNIPSKNEQESLIALVIGIVYMTGRSVKNVLDSPFGPEGIITPQGDFRCSFPKLPIVYRGGKQDAEVQSIQIPIPGLLREWFDRNKYRLVNKGSIGKTFSINGEQMLKEVKIRLRSLRCHGRYGLKLKRIQVALAAQVTLSFRDPVLTAVFAGDFNENVPVLSYYRAVSRAEVHEVYEQISSVLMSLPFQEKMIRFGVPVPDSVTAFIKNLVLETEKVFHDQQANIVVKHNYMAMYTWTLLHFATGHRPIQDPFCYFRDIDLENGMVLVSDKVTSERHHNRLIFLPDMAIQQLEAYITHLTRLARSVGQLSGTQGQVLKNAVINMLSGENVQKLPFLFLLDDLDNPTVSITRENQELFWSQFGEIPLNSGRSVLATELVSRKVPAPLVELILGHLSYIHHPWGSNSEHRPVEDGRYLSEQINDLLHDLGMKVLKTYEYKAVNRKSRRAQFDGIIHGEKDLGPEIRAADRMARSEKRKYVVREALKETEIEGARFISASQVKELEASVLEIARINRVSQDSCIRLTRRMLRLLASKGVKIENLTRGFILAQESSPITPEVFLKRSQTIAIRDNFIQYLERQGKLNAEVVLETRVSEIILAAVLEDGVFGEENLKAIGVTLSDGIFVHDGFMLAELDSIWWVPGELSAALITGFVKRKRDKVIDQRRITGELKRLIRAMGGSYRTGNVYNWMGDVAANRIDFESPGFVRSARLLQKPAARLPRKALQRLLTKKRLEGQVAEVEEEGSVVEWIPLLSGTTSASLSTNKALKSIHEIFKDVVGVEPKGKNRMTDAQLKAFKNKLRSFVEDTEGLTSILTALCGWLIMRCDKGRSGKRLKLSSIRRYESELFKPLANIMHNQDLYALDAESYEAFYRMALNWNGRKDKAYRVKLIRDFHEFLYDHYAIDEPEWSGLYAYANARERKFKIDANIVTDVEYEKSFEVIFGDKSLSPLERDRYAALLFLGFRFGLRFGEALRLRHVDLLSNGEQVFVQVRNNIYREIKSPAGIRQVPFVGRWSDTENELFERLLEKSTIAFEEDPQALLLNMGDPRGETNAYRASRYLNSLLKHVSGDPGVRFHHLRHTWVNRMIAIAYPGQTGVWSSITSLMTAWAGEENAWLLWGKDENSCNRLRGISDAIGHSDQSTTLSSYFHLHDFSASNLLFENRENLKLRAYCYALQEGYGVLNGRKEKNKTETTLHQKIMKAEKIQKVLGQIPLPVQFHDLMSPWQGQNNTEEILDLNKIDRILTVVSNRWGNLSHVGELFGIPINSVIKIMATAMQLERSSGYESYQAAMAADDLLVRDIQFKMKRLKSKLNVAETNRFRKFSKSIEDTLGQMGVNDLKDLADGLKAWEGAHQPSINNYIFVTIDQLRMFLALFRLLEISEYVAELKRSIGEVWSDELYMELANMGVQSKAVKYRNQPMEKSTVHRQYNLAISITNISEGIQTSRAMNRLLFCIGVLLKIR